MNYALKKLFDTVELEFGRIPQKVRALDKLALYINGTEKPKRETLDKISLLVGFQNWEAFKDALNGEADGQENFKD